MTQKAAQEVEDSEAEEEESSEQAALEEEQEDIETEEEEEQDMPEVEQPVAKLQGVLLVWSVYAFQPNRDCLGTCVAPLGQGSCINLSIGHAKHGTTYMLCVLPCSALRLHDGVTTCLSQHVVLPSLLE